MVFGRRQEEEIPTKETKIWECSSEGCKCWVRDNFKSGDTPTCPICSSEMVENTKVLSVIENHSKSHM